MSGSKRNLVRGGLVASLVALPLVLAAAERRAAAPDRDAAATAETVEMFAAMESQDIEVKLIPKDVAESRVIIKNKTKKPLNVRLPQAFVGVPVVLAQPGGGGGRRGGGGGAGGGGNNQNQSMGGGMGGGGGMMGGMMSIPPEKVAQFKVATVCLEHGKKDPRPVVPYEIRPVESFTSKPEVKQLLVALGSQQLDQRSAQAAAWHLANDMSWEELASKKIVHLNGASEIWFSPQEIQSGIQIAQYATTKAREQAAEKKGKEKPAASPGESDATLDELIGKAE